jgi:hypothetical protein
MHKVMVQTGQDNLASPKMAAAGRPARNRAQTGLDHLQVKGWLSPRTAAVAKLARNPVQTGPDHRQARGRLSEQLGPEAPDEVTFAQGALQPE